MRQNLTPERHVQHVHRWPPSSVHMSSPPQTFFDNLACQLGTT
ncbi:hypothetical protein SLEP1_g42886 [Rubroshorea leprosula]|uniref:Uncharacterized protein n=1 Tax=Rubroshorea leprosula TaxID=152421 RepID=A0AAV5LB93_9ROSI|nr:hypothetical protein SLEP1_g42886 [Rubroshorea leprosula]